MTARFEWQLVVNFGQLLRVNKGALSTERTALCYKNVSRTGDLLMSTSKNALITRLTRLLSVSFTCALLLTTIPASAQEDDEEDDMTTSEMLMEAVSYTHLTLPTICSV